MGSARNMIGPNVRRIRSNRQVSQPALAELLQRNGWDISRDTIAKIEDQRRWVSDFETMFIAEALKVPVTELLRSTNRGERARDFVARLERQIA